MSQTKTLDGRNSVHGLASSKQFSLGIVLVLWILAVTLGTLYGIQFQKKPSPTLSATAPWPYTSILPRTPTRHTLVMFVHPRCPCSRASLSELNVLMTGHSDRITAHVVFFVPDGLAKDWAKTDLWDAAQRLDGVTVHADCGGRESHVFGACVSGETYFYSPDGNLLFHGGITAGRGHSGDNLGRSMIQSFLTDSSRNRDSLQRGVLDTPVFGCELRSVNNQQRGGEIESP